MDMSQILVALLAAPLAAALAMAALPSKSVPRTAFVALHVASLAAVCAAGTMLVVSVFTGLEVYALGEWFHVDRLAALFVALIAVIGTCTGVYSIPYVRHDVEEGRLDPSQVKQYYAFFSLFLFSMLLTVASNNIIMMWVSVELTTLSTVFLVGVYGTKLALEAAWKYIIVCTAGVAFGLFGTLLVYANAADIMADAHQAVFWTAILPYAGQMDHGLMMIAFVFAAIGFGTKAGLFPMHTWLPDAHSEAPSPVSGLLSGVLLKCAILVVLRFFILASLCVGPAFPQVVMMILGVLSVCYAALMVYRQSDVKRKLAYSSCENVGLIAVCFGIGGPIGIAAGLIHCIGHGLVKSLMFCLSGNVMMKYGTRDLGVIRGVVRVAPVTGALLAAGCLAIAGFPPFALFVSEMGFVLGGVAAGQVAVVVIVVAALVVVIMAFAHVITGSVLGEAPAGVERGDVSPLALAPEVVLLALIVWMGVAMPGPLAASIGDATGIVLQQDMQDFAHDGWFVEISGVFAGGAEGVRS
ncbi:MULTISPECIES: hydrogenase 4 subunit F [unclassified Adlercreutzia]|uniref:hydrogenase 4 subunit F n=1 Tax=unclassified Adlercreutzia TaxID=2636013 RepID=UPI0013EE010E|nr:MULTISPECIES: hydrogenase 4 subunit F [unclassified Adlercreutzia]